MVAENGSPERTLIIRYDPKRRNFIIGMLLCVLLAIVLAAFYGGRLFGVEDRADAIAEQHRLAETLKQRQEELSSVQQKITSLVLGSKIDKDALEQVRKEVGVLRSAITGLEEEIGFYRSLMDPTSAKNGLDIRSFVVSRDQADGVFRYRLIVQQLGLKHPLLKGTVSVKVSGLQDGQEKVWSLSKLSRQIKEESIRLRFRYFQNVDGQIEIPEGFVPQQVQISARRSGSKGETVEKSFDWIVEEV